MRILALQYSLFTYGIVICMACCTQGYSFFPFFSSSKKSASQEVNEWVRTQLSTLTNETVSYRHQPLLMRPLSSSGLIGLCHTRGNTHREIMTAEEAEALFVREYIPLYKLWNNIPELRPYLKSFPIPTENCSLSIRSFAANGEERTAPNIGVIENMWDDELDIIRIDPRRKDPTTGSMRGGLWRVEKRKLSESSQQLIHDMFQRGVPRKRVGEPITPPIRGKDHRNELREQHPQFLLAFDISWDFAQQHALNISAAGRCGENRKNYRMLSCSFWAQREETLESVQSLAKKLFIHMYTEAKRNPSLSHYLKQFQFDKKEIKSLHINDVSFRISFWDPWVNRVEAPHIAEVRCLDGIITYFTADENQHLVKILEEPVPKVEDSGL